MFAARQILELAFNTALMALSSTSEGFKAKTEVKTDIINEFLFADDCALNATIKATMQNTDDKFSMACDSLGLTISIKRDISDAPASAWKAICRAQHHHQGTTTESGRKVHLLWQHYKSIIMDNKENTKLTKASSAFGRLNRNVWNRRGISETTKIKLYQAVILTTLLYGCEMWTTYLRYIKKLNHFYTTCLKKILGIIWQKHIPNTKV